MTEIYENWSVDWRSYTGDLITISQLLIASKWSDCIRLISCISWRRFFLLLLLLLFIVFRFCLHTTCVKQNTQTKYNQNKITFTHSRLREKAIWINTFTLGDSCLPFFLFVSVGEPAHPFHLISFKLESFLVRSLLVFIFSQNNRRNAAKL